MKRIQDWQQYVTSWQLKKTQSLVDQDWGACAFVVKLASAKRDIGQNSESYEISETQPYLKAIYREFIMLLVTSCLHLKAPWQPNQRNFGKHKTRKRDALRPRMRNPSGGALAEAKFGRSVSLVSR